MEDGVESQWKELLRSPDLEEQVKGLQIANQAIQKIANEAVDALRHTANTPIFADYLSRLGPVIVRFLKKPFQAIRKAN